MIHRLHLFTTNAYLVTEGAHAWLIDSGLPRDWNKLLRLIRAQGVEPGQLKAVLHTHGHSDHAGNSLRLREEFKLPLVMHRAELGRVERGENGPLTPASWMAPFTIPFLVHHFPGFTPDVILDNDLSPITRDFGFPGKVLLTPGHTMGSISFLLGHEAIVGDLVRGSLIPFRRCGAPHFYHENAALAQQSLHSVRTHGVTTFHPGHFRRVLLGALPPDPHQRE